MGTYNVSWSTGPNDSGCCSSYRTLDEAWEERERLRAEGIDDVRLWYSGSPVVESREGIAPEDCIEVASW